MEAVGTNVTYEVSKGKLTITVNLDENHGASKSGKTEVIATSRGNVRVEGTEAFFGLNVYQYPSKS